MASLGVIGTLKVTVLLSLSNSSQPYENSVIPLDFLDIIPLICAERRSAHSA
ncbi:hypothetical protein PMI02_01027, partial [Novosphingobium sp. AP12]